MHQLLDSGNFGDDSKPRAEAIVGHRGFAWWLIIMAQEARYRTLLSLNLVGMLNRRVCF